MVKNFAGTAIGTESFIEEMNDFFENVEVIQSNELLTTNDLNSILHIMCVCLDKYKV